MCPLSVRADTCVYGKGFDTETFWVGAGSLSFWGLLLFLLVFCGFPAGFPTPVAVFLSVDRDLPAIWYPLSWCWHLTHPCLIFPLLHYSTRLVLLRSLSSSSSILHCVYLILPLAPIAAFFLPFALSCLSVFLLPPSSSGLAVLERFLILFLAPHKLAFTKVSTQPLVCG